MPVTVDQWMPLTQPAIVYLPAPRDPGFIVAAPPYTFLAQPPTDVSYLFSRPSRMLFGYSLTEPVRMDIFRWRAGPGSYGRWRRDGSTFAGRWHR